MSDEPRKKKKRNKNKNKKKGNQAGPASANSLQFKVDISPSEEAAKNDGASISAEVNADDVALNPDAGVEQESKTESKECCDHVNEGVSDKVVKTEHEEHYETVQGESPEVDTHSVITTTTTTTTTYETEEPQGDDSENVVVDVQTSSWQVDNAVAETITEFLSKDETTFDHQCPEIEPGTPIHKFANSSEGNVVVDVQKSPWKVDTDVQEIVQHNKRVRMTKITKSRKVIITKTENGEEIETVVEEEDDDSPEVIGEIGEFGENENETVEIQRIVKKRRVILRKTVDGEEIETMMSDDGEDVDHEETTLVSTRKVIITQDETGEDVETVVEQNQPTPAVFQEKADLIIAEATVQIKDDDDNDVIHSPVEVTTVESEIDFHTLLGPPDEEHEKALKQQEKHVYHAHEVQNVTEEDAGKVKPSVEGKEVINEECYEIRKNVGEDEVETEDKIKTNSNLALKIKHDPNVESKTILRVPSQRQTPMKHELTEDQKLMLSEVKMPKVKNALDDWVLVNFTAKEIARFAELMRYKPGWMDDSVEMQSCCKMM